MDLQNFIYLLLALVWLSGLIWSCVIVFKNRRKKMKMYVVRKYHGHASWIDPKHLAEYTETEFETRHEALAHCEKLKGKGIVEIYQREVIE